MITKIDQRTYIKSNCYNYSTSSRGFSNWRFTLSACARITGTRIHVAVTLTSMSFYNKNIKQKMFTQLSDLTTRWNLQLIKLDVDCPVSLYLVLTQIFLVSFTNFISSSLYPFERTGALCENRLKAYCIRKSKRGDLCSWMHYEVNFTCPTPETRNKTTETDKPVA